jgi:hypothetical protein
MSCPTCVAIENGGRRTRAVDEAKIRDGLLRHWRFEGIDYDKSHEIYHDDAVLEFPQSGERFVGNETRSPTSDSTSWRDLSLRIGERRGQKSSIPWRR